MGFRKLRAAAYNAKRGIQQAMGISPKLPEMPQESVEEPKDEAPPVVEAKKEAPAKEQSAPKKTESKKAPAKKAPAKKAVSKKSSSNKKAKK